MRNSRAGFSLIEIMVVVVIIGLLAGVVAVNVMQRLEDAKVNKAKADIAALSTALDLYKLDNGNYPTDLGSLVGGKKAYLKTKEIPKDPWNNPYALLVPGQNGDFDLVSGGGDGAVGGGDDIESWNLNAKTEK